MKNFILMLAFIVLGARAFGQVNRADFGILKRADEEALFGFNLKNSNKIAVLCMERGKKYLVYRFGTRDKIELQYPSVLNAASWRLFKYSGYSRGGGKANEAEELHSISFINNGVGYKIYDDWNINEGSEMGIMVNIGKKQTTILGSMPSKTGSLGSLRDYGKLIRNTYWDE